MSEINKYLKYSKKFSKKYIKEYLILMLKPIIVGLIGYMFVQLAMKNPFFIIFVFLITFPCIFWAFWRGYVITYALNYAAYDFYNDENDYTLLDFIEQNKKQMDFIIEELKNYTQISLTNSKTSDSMANERYYIYLPSKLGSLQAMQKIGKNRL